MKGDSLGLCNEHGLGGRQSLVQTYLSAEGSLQQTLSLSGPCLVISKMPASLSYTLPDDINKPFPLLLFSSFASTRADTCGGGRCTQLCARPDREYKSGPLPSV